MRSLLSSRDSSSCRRLSAPKVESAYQSHGQSGHRFAKKTFTRPTFCQHCTELLWGFTNQGFICDVCNFVSHDRCLSMVVTPCISIATSLITSPVQHTWEGISFYKKKYCCVCRKKLEDNPAFRCQVCEYFIHEVCKEFSISDCKQSSTFIPHLDKLSVCHPHHWREGNLSGSSKCMYCKRTCGTAECFASYRCTWCSTTAHSSCFALLPKECQFGYIKRLVLLPSCVEIINTKLWKSLASKQISKDCQNRINSNTSTELNICLGELSDKDLTYVNVYDGNLNEPQTRKSVLVLRTAHVKDILSESLKMFCINDDPDNYYLAKVLGQEKERPLGSEEMPVQFPVSEERPMFFLRNRKADRGKGYIRIYAGMEFNVCDAFKTILVEAATTVPEVIDMALKKFNLQEDLSPDDVVMTEMSLYNGLQERCMQDHESPWKCFSDVKKKSLELVKFMRFYLHRKPDPSSSCTICIGNLPTGLDKQKYQALLDDKCQQGQLSVEYVHAGSGMLFARYMPLTLAEDAIEILKSTQIGGKEIFVKILPTFHPEVIPKDRQPLLVFVNPKSGGGQGDDMMSSFQRLLNPYQVYNLMDGGPLPGLYAFKDISTFRVLICGGDGSVGWVLSCLDDLSCLLCCKKPPSAIVPLGTGNDLSRVLNWGGGYSSGDTPLSLLMSVNNAVVGQLDRWLIMFDAPSPHDATDDDEPNMFVMNNYFGIGIDADLSLDFHMKREESPEKFTSRLHNKGVYFRAGLRKMTKRSTYDLSNEIDLEVDGEVITLPSLEGIVVLNIGSWAAGGDLWGPDEKHFYPSSHSDGLVEIVGLTGIMQMGQIQSGIRSGVKIAQGCQINMKLKCDLPVHIDGEPWIQSAGQIIIRPSLLQASMLTKRKVKSKQHYEQAAVSRPTSAPLSRSTFYYDGDSSSNSFNPLYNGTLPS